MRSCVVPTSEVAGSALDLDNPCPRIDEAGGAKRCRNGLFDGDNGDAREGKRVHVSRNVVATC